jgi:flagellar biosynthetic protein FliR
METVTPLVVPFMLILARVSAFVAVLPIFGWKTAPMLVRAGMALVLSVVLAMVVPPPADVGGHWVAVGIALAKEAVVGLGLGLAVALVFAAVRQAGMIIRRQMGLAMASVIDPLSGERSQPLASLMELCFAVFFLAAGGHQMMLRLVAYSYEAFPVGRPPAAAAMAEAVIEAGAAMLVFALRLAAPLVAAFLVLAVILAILARILPEMNILFASLPLRMGMGLLMAAALMPLLNSFTGELGGWLTSLMAT